MRFGNSGYLWFLLLVPLGALFYAWVFRSKQRALEKFAEKGLLEFLMMSVSPGKQRLRPVLFMLGVVFIVFSLIQPKWGYHWEELKRRGLDVVVALDVSQSMLAEDVKPNRLETAKREIKSLINALKGDRIAIAAFAGTAFVHCPLTLD
ncbi:MAG: VWA domain-containing protein, partial [Candidatus Omnitrophota bacterium]